MEFDDIIEFTAKEIRKWLITCDSINEHKFVLVAQLQEEARKFEKKIFNENVKMEIAILSIKDFIKTMMEKFLQ